MRLPYPSTVSLLAVIFTTLSSTGCAHPELGKSNGLQDDPRSLSDKQFKMKPKGSFSAKPVGAVGEGMAEEPENVM